MSPDRTSSRAAAAPDQADERPWRERFNEGLRAGASVTPIGHERSMIA